MPRSRRNEMAATIPADPAKDAFGLPMDDDRRPADEDGNHSSNGNGAATATAETTPGEQSEIWPELDESNPQQKALLRAARAFYKAKSERESLLSTSKENCDGLMQKVIGLMHESGVSKFSYKGIKAELIQTKEKAVVKQEDDDEDDDDE